MSKAIKYWTNG